MRVNVLQHAPNEGPGSIQDWCHARNNKMFVYHPADFGILPTVEETDLLIILGSPNSPNDDLDWIKKERVLIRQMLAASKPILGICFGSQQIAKTLGCQVLDAPAKEVGWAPVYLQDQTINGLPHQLTALHWHQQMSEIPAKAKLLFSSDLIKNQGYLLGNNVIGLQFHFEPKEDNVREIAINDGAYALENNDLQQTPSEIMKHGVPKENKTVMFKLLDYITR